MNCSAVPRSIAGGTYSCESTASEQAQTNKSLPSDDSLSRASIAGIVVGIVAFAVAMLTIALLLWLRSKREPAEIPTASEQPGWGVERSVSSNSWNVFEKAPYRNSRRTEVELAAWRTSHIHSRGERQEVWTEPPAARELPA